MALFGRHKKKKSTLKKAIGVFVIPVAIFLSVLFVWWWVGDFWTYTQLLLFNQSSGVDADWVKGGDTYASGSNGMTFSGGSGATGANLALINQMQGGYLKDYLEIASKHADYTYMNLGTYPEYGTNLDVFKLADGSRLEIDVTDILGIAFNETGTSGACIPTSSIDPSRYGEIVNGSVCDFYHVDSEWFKKYGYEYINKAFDYAPGMMLTGAETSSDPAHTTQFQFSSSFFNHYPDGDNNISDSNGYDRWLKTPSTLKPGTVNTIDTNRLLADSDGAYLPDQLSALLRSAYGRMLNSSVGIDVNKLNATGEKYVKYMGYPIGHHNGSLPKFLAFGCHKDTNVEGLTRSEAGALAANQMGEIIEKVESWLLALDDPDSCAFNLDPGIRYNYQSLAQGMLLFGYGGFVRTEESKAALLANLDKSDGMQGFVLALQLCTGSSSKTEDDVRAWFDSHEYYKPNLANYGDRASESHYYYPYIYVQDNAAQVSYNGGPQVPVLHCWNKTDAGGLIMQLGGGKYGYWKCLQEAGVDCTYSEAMGDTTGNLIEEIPIKVKNEPTEFYRGITMRDAQGHVLADSIAALERELTVECYCGEHATGKLSSKGAGYYYWYKGMSEGFLCKWHQTTAYYNRNGTGCSDGATYFPDAKRQGWFLQCPWWAVGRAREYIESRGYVQPDNFSDNGVAVAGRLVAMGYRDTGANPTGPGIISWSAAEHEYGHVAFIEIVDTDGTYYISEAGSGRGFYGINTQSAGQTYRKWGNNYYLKTTVALDP